MKFRNETTFSGSELVDIYSVIEIVIERENEFIRIMSEPNEYEDEDYSKSIQNAKKHIEELKKKHIEELKALQNKLLTD